jgi:protocatechuate 3,4-dioxygenase beta subunit
MTHGHGLFHDLPHLLQRRRFLQLLGIGGTTLIAGCDSGLLGAAEPNVTAAAADGTSCIKTPVETAGPFPADGSNSASGSLANVLAKDNIIRQDIRPNLAPDTTVASGVRLDIEIKLVSIAATCEPVPRYLVYVWHCDAAGRYSIYDLPNANYLRGVVVSEANGIAKVTTVFPGCYEGRWPHIHFEVFTGWTDTLTVKDSVLISQFALPEDACKAVYAASPDYAASAAALPGVTLAGDGIFRGNTKEQLAAQTLLITGDPAKGYKAAVTIGLA